MPFVPPPQCAALAKEANALRLAIARLRPTNAPEAGQLAALVAQLKLINEQQIQQGCFPPPPPPVQGSAEECAALAQQADQLLTAIRNLRVTNAPEAGYLAQLAAELEAVNEQQAALGCYPTPVPLKSIEANVMCVATQWNDYKDGTGSANVQFGVLFNQWPQFWAAIVSNFTTTIDGADISLTTPGSGSYVPTSGLWTQPLPLQVSISGLSGSATIQMSTAQSIAPLGMPAIPGSNVSGTTGKFVLVGKTSISILSHNINVWLRLAGTVSPVPS